MMNALSLWRINHIKMVSLRVTLGSFWVQKECVNSMSGAALAFLQERPVNVSYADFESYTLYKSAGGNVEI